MIGQSGSRSAVAQGEREDVQIGNGQLGQQRVGVGELLLSLTGKADHDIGADGAVGDLRDDPFGPVGVVSPAVAPAHAPENGIVTALQRDVEMAAELGRGGREVDQRV